MRNLKKLFAVVVVIAVVLTTMIPAAFAEGTTALSADAKACADIGMLVGDGSGVTTAYTATQPARIQALVMILNLKGVLADAQKTSATADNFSDVTAGWMKPLTAYAKAHPELGFVGDNNKFDPNSKIDAKQYYSVMLTALGYKGDYTWSNVISFAASKGLSKALDASKFTVDTLATATVETLNATVKGSDKTLVATLADANADFAAKAKAAGFAVTPAVALSVKSVSILNADQIQVVFNTKVNSTSAQALGNYYLINGAGLSNALSVANAGSVINLQSDDKTAIITLNTPLVNDAVFGFKVSGVIDTVGATVADYSCTLTASDKTAPTLVSATSSAKVSTNTITLKFSEPVDTSVASVTVDGTFATLTQGAGADKNTITVNTGSYMLAASSHTLSIMNFKDYAGNFIATNPLPATVAVATDTTAPIVTNVVVKGDGTLQVTFDKAMNIATLTANTNVILRDSGLGTTAGTLGAAAAADGTNKVFNFAILGTTWPSSNTMNAIVALNSSVADSAGNTLAAITKNVTFSKDTVAPGLVSATYKNVTSYGTTGSGTAIATANGSIVFKFNESINAGAAPSTVINDQGSAVAGILGTPVVNNADDTELVVPLTAGVASGTSTYMILLPTGMVTDKAQTANNSAAINQVVNVSAGAVVAGDTTAPAINGTPIGTTTSLTSGSVITINYTEAGAGLDLTTVVNTNNYRVDGLPLPAGSYVTVTGPNATTITIPSGNITADKTAPSGYILTVTGIKDKAGNIMATQVANITLQADAQPVLNSAVLNGNGTVTAGFSLAVNAASSVTTGANLVVTVNGTALTYATSITPVTTGTVGAPTQYTITDGTGADAGKYVITVYDAADHVYSLNNATSISVATAGTTVSGATTISASAAMHAAVKAGTTITVR